MSARVAITDARVASGALRCALLAALVAATAGAQRPRDDGAHRDARRAIARFEAARVRDLPDAPGGGGRRCDAQIGRFCYWYDEEAPDPPPEPASIVRARGALVAALDSLAARAPADGWLAGQRVRYLVEGGHAAEGVRAAAACAAPAPGWCEALRGLAAHAAGRTPAAELAFDSALARFGAADRCRWTDLRPLLDGALRSWYARLPCAGRDSVNWRLWWLARPLHGRPGNALRAEQLARLTMARLLEQGRSPLDPRWGDDERELVVRYGWPTAFTRDRARERPGSGGGPAVSGHEPRPAYHFFPDLAAARDPTAAHDGSWSLDRPRAPSRYAPGLRIAPLAQQTAWFRRGDSTLVAVAYAPPAADRGFAAGGTALLALARDPYTPPVIVPAAGIAAGIAARVAAGGAAAPRGVLTATAPWRPTLVAVELVAAGGRAARRARHGLGAAPPAAPLTLSSILLFEPAGTLPTALAGALGTMRPGVRVRRGERLGLFWELYGLADSARTVTVALGAERVGGVPLLARAARAAGLRRPPAPVAIRWGARPARGAGVASGAIVLRAADLAPGRHRLTIEVRDGAGAAATAWREIVVER